MSSNRPGGETVLIQPKAMIDSLTKKSFFFFTLVPWTFSPDTNSTQNPTESQSGPESDWPQQRQLVLPLYHRWYCNTNTVRGQL